jgi:uncharacterized protein YaeQ
LLPVKLERIATAGDLGSSRDDGVMRVYRGENPRQSAAAPSCLDEASSYEYGRTEMALGATVYHFKVELADVDRSRYETLDLRLARHPSESLRYLLTRTLAYCLCHEEGIAFSKGGLGASEDPPVSVVGADGTLWAWIDVGAPSARRLHKAAKAARRVALFTHVSHALLLAEADSAPIHRREEIEVWRLEPAFLDPVCERLERKLDFSLTRTDGLLYLNLGAETFETPLVCTRLIAEPSPDEG